MTDQLETKALETIKLGTVEAVNSGDVIAKATVMAKQLAEIINDQNLYTIISRRKYVNVEGWNTLGAMIGILPREVEVIEHENGDFEATIELIRVSDGMVVGRASGIVGYDEPTWQKRPRYARRSMAVTRTTGKAFRLGFSWIIKLAGFEPTPAEEMPEIIDGHFEEQPPQKPPQKKRTNDQILDELGFEPDEQEPEPEPEPKVKSELNKPRPWDPETLKGVLDHNATLKSNFASDKQRNFLAALLGQYFQDDDKRYTASLWLFGEASTKNIEGAMVRTALDWLKPVQDSGGAYTIDETARKELSQVLTEALKAEGQEALL